MNTLRQNLAREVGKVVVGQGPAVDALLVAIAVGGHVLLEGVPGVAKTLLARSFGRALGLSFGRIQYTPDMLPSDVTGTTTLRGGELAFREGPIFSNVVLGDEINRTPPKTQAATLEAMQEGSVTVDGVTHALPDPFLVIATQNPIEYEGTYPLPEAQLDRFLMKLDIGYPSEEDEIALSGLARGGVRDTGLELIDEVAGRDEVLGLRELVDQTLVTDEVRAYAVRIIRETRSLPAVELGASPRSGVHLLAAAKGAARLVGRDFVTPDDIKDVAAAVLRHRIVLRPEAELDRYRVADAIEAAVGAVPVPQ